MNKKHKICACFLTLLLFCLAGSTNAFGENLSWKNFYKYRNVSRPYWNPDSSKIVFTVAKRGTGKTTLYLVSADAKDINMDLIKELGAYLKNMAPEAIIRSGDYPREKGMLDVTLVLSELSDVEKVRGYFTKAISLITALKRRQDGIVTTQRGIDITIKDIPSLL